MSELELIKAPKLLPPEQSPEPTLGQVLQGLVQRGQLTTESVAVAREVMAMMERQEARQAEKSYVAAFNALQSAASKVKATHAVPNNDGSTRFVYADYEDIYDQLKPLLDENGFAWSVVDTVFENNRVFVVGQLQHVGGHKQTFRYGVQITAPPKATATQGDGSSISYAKRGCLTSAFNIVVERAEQQDARNVGHPITKEQAADLRKRVLATGSDEQRFLAYGQSPIADNATQEEVVRAYEAIPSSMLGLLNQNLARKENTTK